MRISDWSSDVCSSDLLFVRLEDNAVVIGEKDGDQYVVTNALTGDVEAMAAADELKPIALDAESKALLGANAGAAPADTGPVDFATGDRKSTRLNSSH